MKKNRLIRASLVALSVVLAAGLIYVAFLETMPGLLPLLQNGNEAQIEAYLRSADKFSGYLCTALLQIVQVFSVVLPGAPIQIAAGIVYGTWRSFLICHLSSVAANIVVFSAVRHLGTRMDKLAPVEKRASRLDFILKSDTPAYMTAVACLIPVLPNGFIPYVAARTKIKTRHFALAMYFGSLLPVFVLCASGSQFLEGGYVASAILLAALFAVVFLLTKFRDDVLKLIKKVQASIRKKKTMSSHKKRDGA
jgi:uncharacterized membrane protein YdjX (TVP38/TMEM64 family)